jgi:hypothetical protein
MAMNKGGAVQQYLGLVKPNLSHPKYTAKGRIFWNLDISTTTLSNLVLYVASLRCKETMSALLQILWEDF